MLVLYTDGVTDARRAGETFGESRVAEAVTAGGTPADVLDRIRDGIAGFTGASVGDDIAMLAAQVRAAPLSGRGSA